MEIQPKQLHGALAQIRHYAETLLAISLLLFSWYLWYLFVMALTEGWGAPWDTTDIRPPVGHWQRILNDFFESGIGAYLPTAVSLALSFLLYIHAIARTQHPQAASAVFGFTNLLALSALFLVGYLLQVYLIHTPTHLTPDDWSYWGDFRREWPLSLAAIVCFTTLFLLQPHLLRCFLRHYDFIGITKS